jgi:xanthine dehydrogenase YagT iron-sulfur-binding subunit
VSKNKPESPGAVDRRAFMQVAVCAAAGSALVDGISGIGDAQAGDQRMSDGPRHMFADIASCKASIEPLTVSLTVNDQASSITVEPRMTLLDALREKLALTGTKKACDRGECGACTVHVNGRRVLSCMMLAAMAEGKRVTTIEGLVQNGKLHPLQSAFIEHDGFQCGFCTSGQIMSGIAMIEEAKAGSPSAATADVRHAFSLADLSCTEIQERISGNLCRCACYPNIVDAVVEVISGS